MEASWRFDLREYRTRQSWAGQGQARPCKSDRQPTASLTHSKRIEDGSNHALSRGPTSKRPSNHTVAFPRNGWQTICTLAPLRQDLVRRRFDMMAVLTLTAILALAIVSPVAADNASIGVKIGVP